MLRIYPGLREEIEERIKQRSENTPERGAVLTVRAKAIHHLQFRAAIDGFALVADEEERGGGYGAGPSPLRLFLAGILMSHQLWCVKAAALLDVTLDGVDGTINGHLSIEGSYSKNDYQTKFEKLSVEVRVLSPEPSEKVIAVIDKATLRCPVFGTIGSGTQCALTLWHNGHLILEREMNTLTEGLKEKVSI
jgi:uncharacterized OsmC-like protein